LHLLVSRLSAPHLLGTYHILELSLLLYCINWVFYFFTLVTQCLCLTTVFRRLLYKGLGSSPGNSLQMGYASYCIIGIPINMSTMIFSLLQFLTCEHPQMGFICTDIIFRGHSFEFWPRDQF